MKKACHIKELYSTVLQELCILGSIGAERQSQAAHLFGHFFQLTRSGKRQRARRIVSSSLLLRRLSHVFFARKFFAAAIPFSVVFSQTPMPSFSEPGVCVQMTKGERRGSEKCHSLHPSSPPHPAPNPISSKAHFIICEWPRRPPPPLVQIYSGQLATKPHK